MIRSFDPTEINAVINHPSVFPWVTMQGIESIDVSALVENPDNVLLMCEGGGFLYEKIRPGIYEVHTQFIPGVNANILKAAIESVFWMFTNTDAEVIYTEVPADNIRADKLTRKVGFKLVETLEKKWPRDSGPVDLKVYALERNECL